MKKFPLIVFTSVWLILWAWMFLVRWAYPGDLSPDAILRPYMGMPSEINPWLEVWQRWDVLHYQAIAAQGYQAFQTALFTPPLYPFLMRVASFFLGGNTLLGGMLVSVVSCAFSLVAFQRLAQFELGDERLAMRAVLYLALFPSSFFLFAPYTESLFMLGSVSCLLSLRQKNWLAAGAWGMLAACSRLTGAVILLPVLWAAWAEWKLNHSWKVWLAPLLVSLAAATFPLYAWIGLGQSMLAPFQAQSARFHGGFTLPGLNILAAIRQIFANQFPLTNALDLLFTLTFLGLGFLVWKQLPRLYGIYYLGFMALYLTRVAEIYPLLSMGRYVLALFPAFLILARYGESPIIQRIIVYTSLLGALFLSAQYAIWGWVG
jgi:Gpi18-like mannosyltransferase